MNKNNRLLILFLLIVNFSFSQEKKINVYAFVAEECPVSISMAPTLQFVSEMYGGKANFYLVFPFATSTGKSTASFKTSNGLAVFKIKIDKDQSLTKKLGASVTPEVVITDTDDMILYKGRINDSFLQPGKKNHLYASNDLADALQNITNGKEMPRPWKPAVGCYITLEKESP